jgi:hypothetical protein
MNFRKADQLNMLIEDIRLASGINQLEAEQAAGAVISFLSARLPSPVMGRIHNVLFENVRAKGLGNGGN